jgi:hypothetical protein
MRKEELKEKSPPKTSLHKSGEGFNLIAPQLEKIEKETKEKLRIDIRVVLFVFFVVLVSLGIAGYNWYVTMSLEKEKDVLEELKESLEDYEYTIQANNQILERYTSYESIQEGFISSKEVLNFWQEVSENLGEIRNIELSNGINFEVSGRASSLRDVTKLWHFLSIDDRVKSVTLEGVSIPSDRDSELSFSFKGVLNLEYFNKRK